MPQALDRVVFSHIETLIILILIIMGRLANCNVLFKINKTTRMYSSRMHTARLFTVSQHALLGGVPTRVVCLPGGVSAWGVYLPRGTCPGTPPVNRMTDRCKNITLP